MSGMKKLALIGYLLLHGIAASATPVTTDHAQIKNVAARFVQQQSRELPGKVTYTIDEIDPRIAMPACLNLGWSIFGIAGRRLIPLIVAKGGQCREDTEAEQTGN